MSANTAASKNVYLKGSPPGPRGGPRQRLSLSPCHDSLSESQTHTAPLKLAGMITCLALPSLFVQLFVFPEARRALQNANLRPTPCAGALCSAVRIARP